MKRNALAWLGLPIVLSGCSGAIESLTGYTASMMCSKTFVTGLDRETVYQQDLIPITNGNANLAKIDIDYANKVVTSTVLNVTSLAVYRDGLGCTLVGDEGLQSLVDQAYPIIPDSYLDSSVPWPYGKGGVVEDASVDLVAIDNLAYEHFKEFKPYQVKTHSLAVVHQGRLVYEKYDQGYQADTPIYGFSVAKTVSALLTGMLVDQQQININQPLMLDVWADDPNDPRNTITVDHLLRMTSGLDFSETYDDPESDANLLFVAEDMARFSAEQPLLNLPGTAFHYSTGDTMVLSQVITDATGGSLSSAHNALHSDLLRKIDINSAVIQADTKGNLVFGMQGLFGTRDLARLGLFLLQEGAWQGEQIISPEWMSYMKTPVALPNDLGYAYGAGIWLNSDINGRQFFPSLPADTMIAFGLRGQFIVASPSLDLVIVRTGSTLDAYDFISDMDVLLAGIVNAVDIE